MASAPLDDEDIVVKFLNGYLRGQSGTPTITGHSAIAEVIDRIDIYRDRLAVPLRSRESSRSARLHESLKI